MNIKLQNFSGVGFMGGGKVAFSARSAYVRKSFLNRSCSGFSLMELLIVLALTTFLGSLSFQALLGLQEARSITRISDTLSGGLELARAQAITHKTYVRFLFSVDNSHPTPRILIASLASRDGNALDASEWEDSMKAGIFSKPAWLDRVVIDSALGAEDDIDITLSAFTPTRLSIGSKTHTFQYAIEFNPSGEARVTPNADRFIKIGLRPSHSNNNNKNLIIRLQGLTGKNEVLRPEPT